MMAAHMPNTSDLYRFSDSLALINRRLLVSTSSYTSVDSSAFVDNSLVVSSYSGGESGFILIACLVSTVNGYDLDDTPVS